MRTGVIAKKLGMTRFFDEAGADVAVTVLSLDGCQVTAHRTKEKDGYTALQLGAGKAKVKNTSKAMRGHFAKALVEPKRRLVEFRVSDDNLLPVGAELTADHFVAGQSVDVSGITIGKGFQGGIKRHNFSRGPVSHGSHNVRAPGSIGASAFPARVFKGMRMPGQMGNKRRTQRGLEIASIDADRNLLLIKGSVPGAKNSIVEVRTDA